MQLYHFSSVIWTMLCSSMAAVPLFPLYSFFFPFEFLHPLSLFTYFFSLVIFGQQKLHIHRSIQIFFSSLFPFSSNTGTIYFPSIEHTLRKKQLFSLVPCFSICRIFSAVVPLSHFFPLTVFCEISNPKVPGISSALLEEGQVCYCPGSCLICSGSGILCLSRCIIVSSLSLMRSSAFPAGVCGGFLLLLVRFSWSSRTIQCSTADHVLQLPIM